MKPKLIVIGGVAAGGSAAAKARRVNPDLDIKMYAEGEYISYGSCGLPYYIGGLFDDERKLLARTVTDFAQQGVTVCTKIRVLEIIPGLNKVRCMDLNTGKYFEDRYDHLVIATGARPFVPNLPGSELPGVFTLRTINDARNIKAYLRLQQPGRALIVGAGYIGLEMAENLARHGCRVILAEKGPHIIPNMDSDVAAIVQRHLESKGVQVLVNQEITGFGGSGQVCEAQCTGSNIRADIVIMSTGVVPNSEIALAAGIELGAGRAIRVNEKMETNIAGIYAAGDCATATHRLSGLDVYIPMGTTANKQGKVAGENAAGGNARFQGILGTAIARVVDLEISRTGFTEQDCLNAGIEFESHTIKSRTAARYIREGGEIWVKLTTEKKTGRLVGAQIAGLAGAGKRIDILAAAITMGARVDDLVNMDLAYSPPFSPVWDPVLLALNQF